MKVFWPILLQTAAFCLAMAELLLPSFGVLTVLCIGLAGYSWYLIWTTLPSPAMVAFFIADLALIPAGFYLGIRLIGRSPLSHRSDLGQGTGLESDEKRLQLLIGQEAVVETMLRPAGKVRIGEDIYEAITGGDFIAKGMTVKIIALNAGALQVEASLPGHAKPSEATDLSSNT
jgi:membrane-bound ClpP family serine protease